ncbi:MAG: small basic protein [Candidatus Omnitrophota bacterium]|nr:MAG: small basic protein [Candidatus Omnitrophota bacterium]
MSLHPSLKRAEKLTSNRSVMKRTERIKWLMDKDLWKEDSRVLGLPKIKVVKLKAAKKEKVKEEQPQEEQQQQEPTESQQTQ